MTTPATGLVSVFILHRDAIKADGAESDDDIEDTLFEEEEGLVRVNTSVKGIYYDNYILKAESLLLEPKYAGVLDDDYYRIYYACISHNITALQLFLEYVDQHRSEYHIEILSFYLIDGALNCCKNGDIDSIVLILERFGEHVCIPLFECACQLGDTEVIRLLIEGHRESLVISVPAVLKLVCKFGDADVVEMLVSTYTDLMRSDCIKGFNRACERGHLSVVQILVTFCRDNLDFRSGEMREPADRRADDTENVAPRSKGSNADYSFDRYKTYRCLYGSEIFGYLNTTYDTTISGQTRFTAFLQMLADVEMRSLPPYAS